MLVRSLRNSHGCNFQDMSKTSQQGLQLVEKLAMPLKTVYLQKLKGMQLSELASMCMVSFVRNGVLFLSRMVYKRVGGWTSGRNLSA